MPRDADAAVSVSSPGRGSRARARARARAQARAAERAQGGGTAAAAAAADKPPSRPLDGWVEVVPLPGLDLPELEAGHGGERGNGGSSRGGRDGADGSDGASDDTPAALAVPGATRNLWLVVVASALALSCWFSTNAVAPALEAEEGYSTSEVAWLSSAVQLGFVAGTLALATINVADVMRTRTLFAVSAAATAASNLAVAFVAPKDVGGFGALLVLRALTGMFLGGVYPPA
ncbi:uncharacterized protein AMSG_10313 [Thecamonas trahens ATCC 50062]|uniref:Major facilitator superfamily (MFS) profile domain-containing protein n=1 Tax=Thecamonas trahens ATCC 50062 TaxID=461836 RepID=A0A0L0DQL0_THETB|nr:hypothetical protein AMSG_10313 [Thecamonas trahens ATCC 50062]KNC54326.1 hypothetical protein AMSG_10313 [Thecamonas trahens ATCC 50062]|eukprot:XP_013753785.1 hypothetical protein AMSG_10313 [Thecamonas trahens ATCC 50062]